MAMDKYGVEQVKRMQRDALTDVNTKLVALRRGSLVKTAEEDEKIADLERQQRELVEALAQPDPT